MYFPIGDIHGRYDLVRKLYDKVVAEINTGVDPVNGGTIVFLGDYIDRGPESSKVLDFLMSLEDVSGDIPIKHMMLRGNHEAMMVHCRYHPEDIGYLHMWLSNGGDKTIDSFGVSMQDIVDGALDNYIAWINNRPIIAHDDYYIFVHAGFNPFYPLDNQDENCCLWDFEQDHAAYKRVGRVIVHGHMVMASGPIIDLPNNRIWMDVGAVWTNRLCSVGLPEPYDYGYENPEGYKIIEVKTY